MPSEHGGWGLTLEPVLAGLIVTASSAGVLIGAAAVLTFLVRTPLKLVLVDVHRHRWLQRSKIALAITAVELAILTALVLPVSLTAGLRWLVPIALAIPFVAVEMWFEVHSRGRRLAPELCGAIAIGSAAPAIILAGDGSPSVAAGVWLILSARAIATIPFVRTQIARLRHHRVDLVRSDLAQTLAVIVASGATAVDHRVTAGCLAVGVLAAVQLVTVRRAPVEAKVLGLRQLVSGVAIVVVTALGVRL
jgi:hypothetical protein